MHVVLVLRTREARVKVFRRPFFVLGSPLRFGFSLVSRLAPSMLRICTLTPTTPTTTTCRALKMGSSSVLFSQNKFYLPPLPLLFAPTGVDVSCTEKGASFRGDKENRQQVHLKLLDVVEIAEAHELGKPHWATSEASFFLEHEQAGVLLLVSRFIR